MLNNQKQARQKLPRLSTLYRHIGGVSISVVPSEEPNVVKFPGRN